MQGPVRRPAGAATLVVAVTACAALILVAQLGPATRPPAAARSADPAAACQDLRAGVMVACLHGNDTPPPGVSLFQRPGRPGSACLARSRSPMAAEPACGDG